VPLPTNNKPTTHRLQPIVIGNASPPLRKVGLFMVVSTFKTGGVLRAVKTVNLSSNRKNGGQKTHVLGRDAY